MNRREQALSLVQGSPEWRTARAGSLGASQIDDMLATVKSGGWGASRDNLKSLLVVERLTGKPVDGYVSQAMQNGTAREPMARAAYEFMNDCTTIQVGMVLHPTIAGSHASLDGLVGDDGVLEIKAPEHKAHIALLQGGKIPNAYELQCQWAMACSGRKWTDFISWHPDFPEPMQLFSLRIARNDKLITELELAVLIFLAEVDATVAELRNRYGMEQAA